MPVIKLDPNKTDADLQREAEEAAKRQQELVDAGQGEDFGLKKGEDVTERRTQDEKQNPSTSVPERGGLLSRLGKKG